MVNLVSILAKLGVVGDICKLSIRTWSLRSKCNLSGARKDKFVLWGIIGKPAGFTRNFTRIISKV